MFSDLHNITVRIIEGHLTQGINQGNNSFAATTWSHLGIWTSSC